ncbi:MAG: glycosyltransferase [Gemmatimonadaceae bacterium]
MPVELSVVVPAVNTLLDLVTCLDALEKQRADVTMEVLVIVRNGAEVLEAIPRLFPDVRLIPVSVETTIPQMRATAFHAATGDAVAVIEDHVIVPPGWARQMLGTLAEGKQVVAGSVENAATEKLIDWAAFLCEYSHLIPPIAAGSVPWLTGNNVVYRRALLDAHREVVDAGRWENYLHDTLKAEGVELFCRPEIVVGHKKHYTFGEYFTQRYFYARSYAGARVAGASFPRRMLFGLTAFALPPLLLYRTMTRILAKKRHVGTLFKSIPLISAFVVSWGFGEVVGYWFGAGDSLQKVC